jgi:hypothetical protein
VPDDDMLPLAARHAVHESVAHNDVGGGHGAGRRSRRASLAW